MPAPRTTLALSLLAAIAFTLACHHATDTESKTPAPEALTPPPTAPEVIEWLLGEQVRGTKTSNRGHVGIATYEFTPTTEAAPIFHTETCADLIQLIPIPARSGAWLAIDEPGKLLRYTDGASWSPVPTSKAITLPKIGKLIAFSRSSSPVQLLVSLKGHERELSLLTIVGEQVTGIQSVELSTFKDHRGTLQRYDSARCLEGVRDCLHLTAADGSLILMREPELFDNRVEVKVQLDPGTRDVRYADQTGKKIYLLTPSVCPAPPAPAPAAQPPSAQPKATP